MGLGWDTNFFTKPVVVRVYKGNETGRMEREISELMSNGYQIQGQSGTGSHVNVGRTVTGAVLTGGLSLLLGASRSSGTQTITFIKAPSASSKPNPKKPKRLFGE
jgi:hypothetical protein